jgi:hypothetical protein
MIDYFKLSLTDLANVRVILEFRRQLGFRLINHSHFAHNADKETLVNLRNLLLFGVRLEHFVGALSMLLLLVELGVSLLERNTRFVMALIAFTCAA